VQVVAMDTVAKQVVSMELLAMHVLSGNMGVTLELIVIKQNMTGNYGEIMGTSMGIDLEITNQILTKINNYFYFSVTNYRLLTKYFTNSVK